MQPVETNIAAIFLPVAPSSPYWSSPHSASDSIGRWQQRSGWPQRLSQLDNFDRGGQAAWPSRAWAAVGCRCTVEVLTSPRLGQWKVMVN